MPHMLILYYGYVSQSGLGDFLMVDSVVFWMEFLWIRLVDLVHLTYEECDCDV